jgi:hypothetical protein
MRIFLICVPSQNKIREVNTGRTYSMNQKDEIHVKKFPKMHGILDQLRTDKYVRIVHRGVTFETAELLTPILKSFCNL